MLIGEKCFNDPVMHIKIIQNQSIGKCFFSGMDNIAVIEMDELIKNHSNILRNIFELYCYKAKNLSCREDAKMPRDTLLNILQKQWNFFDLNNISSDNANNILYYLAMKIVPHEKYTKESIMEPFWCDKRYLSYGYFVKEDWEMIDNVISHECRYSIHVYPKLNFEIDNLLEELFYKIRWSRHKGTILYRGRINNTNRKFIRNEMLIPKSHIKSNGRGNPVGINYLYAASNIETVVAEVRAWKGCNVNIACLEIKRDMMFVDIAVAEKRVSILNLYYEDNDYGICKAMEMFEIEQLLFNRLSCPVNPSDSDVEYFFTQYICEKIKMIGYDGIAFKSSVGNQNCYILFSDKDIRVKSIKAYFVGDINYHITDENGIADY